MMGKLLEAIGLLGGRDEALESLRRAVEQRDFLATRLRPVCEELLERPLVRVPAYQLLEQAAQARPHDPRPVLWHAWLMTRSVARGHEPAEADIVGEARALVERGAALGGDPATVAKLRDELDFLLPRDVMTLQVLGLTIAAERYLERGSEAFRPEAEAAAQAAAFCSAFCARLRLREGAGLVRTPRGSFFYDVTGDGESCTVRPVHDRSLQAPFEVRFARQWGALEAQGVV